MIAFWEYGQKRCVIWRKLAFGRQINLACAICWMSCAGIPASNFQRANFHKNIKIMNLQYFWIFMYNWWLLKFVGMFFVKSLPNLVLMPEFSNWSASTAWQVLTTKAQNVNKTAACIHHCPLRHPAPPLRHWYTGVYLRIFDSGPRNPTIFLGLYSRGDYRQSIESPRGVPPSTPQKSRIHSLFMIVFWEYCQKRCVIWWNLTTSKGLFDES